MNKKRWLYLILLIAMLIVCIIKPLLSILGISDEPIFLSVEKGAEILSSIKTFTGFTIYQIISGIFGNIKINEGMFNIALSFSGFICSLISLKVNKMFFKQGSIVIREDFKEVFKKGVLFYGSFIGLILLFFFTVIGFGVSLILLFISSFLIILGKISISLFIGNIITNKKNVYINLLIGFVIIEIIGYFPYFGWFISNIFSPIFAIGVFSQTIDNIYINKKFYEISYEKDTKKTFNKSKIYDIIMSNNESEEE